MSAPILCAREDAAVVRENGKTFLMNCDGDILFHFPEHWSEADAFAALSIANQMFQAGYFLGRGSLREDFQKLLYLGAPS